MEDKICFEVNPTVRLAAVMGKLNLPMTLILPASAMGTLMA
jgi:hypothetical protein